MGRLIDADEALCNVKPYEPSDEYWAVTGGTAIRLIHKAIDSAPSVEAVSLSELKMLRNELFDRCLITADGLEKLNQIIACHSVSEL